MGKVLYALAMVKNANCKHLPHLQERKKEADPVLEERSLNQA